MVQVRRAVGFGLGARVGLTDGAQGVLGIFVNQYFFLLGLGHTNPTVAAVFQPLCPVATAMMGVAVGYEGMAWRKGLGFVLGVGGAMVMLPRSVWHGGGSAAHGDGLGVILLTLNVLAGSVYLLMMKRSYSAFSPLTITAYQYVVGAVCTALAATACHGCPGAFQAPGVEGWATWATLGYAIVVASLVNYFFITWSNIRLDASTVGMYQLLQPVATAVIVACTAQQPLPPMVLVGLLGVGAGLSLITWQQRIELARQDPPPHDESEQPLLINTAKQ